MKRIGVTGAKGKLGSLLLGQPNFISLDCDITDVKSVESWITNTEDLDLIVNCAGISSVDECSRHYDLALKTNAKGLAVLHTVFGKRVLNISTDQVFSGKSWWLPSENTKMSPINNYGQSKQRAEIVSQGFGGKTIRLSRTVSCYDPDIRDYLWRLASGEKIYVPSFFHRNYLHKHFAATGIAYFAEHYDDMPDVVNYGGSENYSMFQFMFVLAEAMQRGGLVYEKTDYEVTKELSPRPKRGGFKVNLAKKLGFPMFDIADTVSELMDEYLNGITDAS